MTEARSDPLTSEIAVEQEHVDLVYARLGEATRSAQEVAQAGRSLHRSDRESYVREEDGTRLYERDVFAFQAAKRLAVLDAEHEGLVFGRLDRTDGEVRYVGRIGVRDEDYEPLVIDWRAPAAEPFYRATPTQPMQVVRRRVLRCQGPKVVGIEDDLLDSEHADGELVVIGEGALMAALSRARGHQMRDIVATIQSEQDEAIRAPYQGFTLISGGPGTGKTVVGLHRTAYLLYSNRRRFESGGVLVVGPSRVFLNYIERVLPSLGEESVTLRSMGSVPSDVVATTGERADDAATAAVKGSLRMLPVLKRLVTEPFADQPVELRVVVQGQVLVVRSGQLAAIRRDVLAHHKLNAGREAAEKALLTALWRSRPSEVDMERDEFDELVTGLASFTMFTYAWWPSVSAPTALRRLADPALARRLAQGPLSAAEADLLSAGLADLDTLGPTVADGALLDELVNLLGPVPPPPQETETSLFLDGDSDVSEVVTTADRMSTPREVDPFDLPHRTYAHVLVDEAQDTTPMQWRMLRRRGASASWTIVGDTAQSSWPDAEEAERALREIIGTAPVRRFRMSTNYRSPAEVFDLASRVVVEAYPEADLPTAVRSTGVEPLLAVAADVRTGVVEQVRALLGEVEGTVGVVCPPSRRDQAEADLAAASLEGAERIAVVTSLESKGLEYDGVLVVTPDDVVAESPGGVRSLYVSLTRPTQRLVTLDEGRPGRWRPAGA
ncbi:HelD family protein [Microlunatus flavus]|uniref:DNA helicase IV n=1 Tax=Microlunatus flavus TaxID=1036181 RepID=A0A1H9HH18_9ACTN|nr:UvrD-helicase domain-containing protein [Microlunatus flavus]SEQ61605.1 DNA helicase IV [Microlunatus flavus]